MSSDNFILAVRSAAADVRLQALLGTAAFAPGPTSSDLLVQGGICANTSCRLRCFARDGTACSAFVAQVSDVPADARLWAEYVA